VIWPKVEYRNTGGTVPHTDSQTPPAQEHNPVIWPKVPNKAAEENSAHEFPKQSFTWRVGS
jgi:hypothetical protein